ncbi:unnamed protein product [Phaedon cochleariae]|uniref:DUF4371 domain-containing protein n=1 Tax=Phaedon cochleariae TaxID=80249 RepID=A0A9N9SQH4_PHACE|nr:unnamed protein product [Phaedon cochleariae]
MDTLVPFCTDISPDSDIAKGIACRATKATAVLKHGLGKIFQDELCDNVRSPGRFFSLVMDETTKVSEIKQCAFTIIFYDVTKVKTRFLDMVSTEKGDGASLYDCLKSTSAKHKIPSRNMVGFSSDTTNVMVGEYNSMFSHLKAKLPDIQIQNILM